MRQTRKALTAALRVDSSELPVRLDQFLARHLDCGRKEVRRLIEDGGVRVDGRRLAAGARLQAGQRVEHPLPSTGQARGAPEPEPEVPLTVLYRDPALLALLKPAGVPSHPLLPGERGTLANALVARHPECAAASDAAREGGLAHRLDIDTSGAILAARTRPAWLALRRLFRDAKVEKVYLALVAGNPPAQGEVRAPLVHRGRRRMAAIDAATAAKRRIRARPASTRYRVLARGKGLALLAIEARTGRMHQVRAHLAHAGHPLCGDALYGGPSAPGGTRGHFLHAARLALPHPLTGEPLVIEAPLPPDRTRALERLVSWSPPPG